MGHLTLLLGGQKSGKSTVARQIAEALGAPVVVLAPARGDDPEFAQRIARHRAERPSSWRTLETFDLAGGLAGAGGGATVVVDALDTWLLEAMTEAGLRSDEDVAALAPDGVAAQQEILDRIDGFLAAVTGRRGAVVAIAGQPGLGPIALGAWARRYVDLHGLVCRRVADHADEVALVVAGRLLPTAPPTGRRGLATADPPPVPPELRDHGDRQVPAGAVDLAVNVMGPPPRWLLDDLAAVDLAAYPHDGAARSVIATRHGRDPAACLPLNGAAEAFALVARALRPRHAACVHPSFTAPEAALRAVGVPVTRVYRRAGQGWSLHPDEVPEDADLVVLGRPDNPTGALDPLAAIEALVRPGRIVVVDEAFTDFLDDAGGLASRPDLPVVAVRSLTKLWGLAGLRVGYLTAPPDVVRALERHRQPWPCNAAALRAVELLCDAEEARRQRVAAVDAARADVLARLGELDGVEVWPSPANFVLVRVPGCNDLRGHLLADGLAARRGATFPGLDPSYVRIAVRDTATHERVAASLGRAVRR